MSEGIVISLEILAMGMGHRGSKSVKVNTAFAVKEQRVDGSSVAKAKGAAVRYTLVARETWFLTFLFLMERY